MFARITGCSQLLVTALGFCLCLAHRPPGARGCLKRLTASLRQAGRGFERARARAGSQQDYERRYAVRNEQPGS